MLADRRDGETERGDVGGERERVCVRERERKGKMREEIRGAADRRFEFGRAW